MRTHLEFRSASLFDAHDDADIPQGETVANLVAKGLSDRGFKIAGIVGEDWGWCVKIHHDEFDPWIGCGFYPEYDDGFLCFIEPSKPFVRRWLKRIPTHAMIERLAIALEDTLASGGQVCDLRWWPQAEVMQ